MQNRVLKKFLTSIFKKLLEFTAYLAASAVTFFALVHYGVPGSSAILIAPLSVGGVLIIIAALHGHWKLCKLEVEIENRKLMNMLKGE